MANNQAKTLVLVVEDVRSLWNVGAMFRTADALGVAKIYLCGITGKPPRKEISKVALGAEAWIPWEHRPAAWEVIRELREKGYTTVALEKTKGAQPLSVFQSSFPLALVVGNEVRGVSRDTLDVADEIVYIPMVGRKESLNVAVAAGMALHAILNR